MIDNKVTNPIDHTVGVTDGVATIVLTRPQHYNALSFDLLDSLLDTLRALNADPAVRSLVITGEGKAFCSGADLTDPHYVKAGETPKFAEFVGRLFNPLFTSLITMEKPVIAAVNGVAAGAGFGIACASDFRIVADTASFTTAFAKAGLVGDTGMSITLPRIVGYARAVELLMLAESIDAGRADAYGLCTKVVPADRCVAEAQALATSLARGPRSLRLMKRELLGNAIGDMKSALALEAELQNEAGESADFIEAWSAFGEKRKPHFRGV